MKHLCYFTLNTNTEDRAEAIRRFRLTEGQPPAEAKLLGRWIRADFSGGIVLLESNDPKALTEFSLMWSDLMDLEIVPVIEDAEFVEVLERTGR